MCGEYNSWRWWKNPLTIQLAKILIRKGYNTHIIKKQYKGSNNKMFY